MRVKQPSKVHIFHKSSWATIGERNNPEKSSATPIMGAGRDLQNCISLNNQWTKKILITIGLCGLKEYATLLPKKLESLLMRE